MAVLLNSDIFIARAELFTLAPMLKTLSHNDMIYPSEAANGLYEKRHDTIRFSSQATALN